MDLPSFSRPKKSPPSNPVLRTRTTRLPNNVLVNFVSTRGAEEEAAPGGPPTEILPATATLAGVAEDALVADLLAQLPSAPTKLTAGELAGAAAGDDCAILRAPGQPGRWRLLKTDCVIEGVHYTPDTEPERVGWKALCRVVSDFAAMGGGEPEHALVTLALPRETTVPYARGLYAGLGRAAALFGVRVVGGETARSPGPAFLSVSVSGTVACRRCVRRAGGRPGDALFVTGRVGGSFASGRHLDFTPRLPEAHWLAANFPVHAMMDLSDGLGADLPRLARASGVGFHLERELVPLSPGCDVEAALNDGEDYELLFALGPRHAERLAAEWAAEFPNLPLTRIGEFHAGVEGTLPAGGGFNHFR